MRQQQFHWATFIDTKTDFEVNITNSTMKEEKQPLGCYNSCEFDIWHRQKYFQGIATCFLFSKTLVGIPFSCITASDITQSLKIQGD